MGRQKGYIPSPEQIAAMQSGRRKAKEAKLNKHDAPVSNGKPIIYITGTERDAFDFYTPLRSALRPLHLYDLLDKIIKEITDKDWYVNTAWVKNKLANYVIIMER